MITELESKPVEVDILSYYSDESYIEYLKAHYSKEYNERMDEFKKFIKELIPKDLRQKKRELQDALETINKSIVNQGWSIIESPDPLKHTVEMEYSLFGKGLLEDQIKLINE